jgi:hypothetical protein
MAERIVSWFSHGAASAIATKIAIAEHGPDLVIGCIDTGSEHDDNPRFRADCERWYDHEILVLKSKDYVDTWDVWERTRFLVGPMGARCTAELKKKVRNAFERPTDLHIFGYTADKRDAARSARFIVQNPGVDARFPLVERGLTKGDCLALVERAGIALPAMYGLGYVNNNCIGCVKGGMGYWNKVRVDFPEVFAKMVDTERDLGHTVLRENGQPLYLDELAPDRGNYKAETISDCSLDCQIVEAEYENVVPVTIAKHLGRRQRDVTPRR